MTAVDITAKAKQKDDESGEVTEHERTVRYDFGDNLDESIKLFTPDVVFHHFRQSATIALQSMMRASALGGETPAALTKKVAEWKPATAAPRKSKVERATDLAAGMSQEEKAAFLKVLKEAA